MADPATVGLGIGGGVAIVVGFLFVFACRSDGGLYRRVPQTAKDEDPDHGSKKLVQYVTFAISLAVQAVGLGLGLSVWNADAPPALVLINGLETTVQAVELGWYVLCGIVFLVQESTDSGYGVGLQWRYLDWVFTTPTMLVTIFFLTLYFENNHIEVAALTEVEGRVAVIVCMAIADLIMLFFGFVYELNKRFQYETTSSIISFFTMNSNNKTAFLLLGFPFLFLAFLPIMISVGQFYSEEGITLLILMFFIWSLYGAVCLLIESDLIRGSFYNILDLFSKNTLGFIA